MQSQKMLPQNSSAMSVHSYLFRQLGVLSLGSRKDEDRAEGGHIMQQGEEGALHSVTHRVPPLGDMWHVHHAGNTSTGLAENLQPER